MTRRVCQEVEALIDREARGFSEAEALLVEQHLGSCASCREALETMRSVRSMVITAPVAMSDTARHRALARAFARTDAIETRRVGGRGRLLGLGLGVAAAAAVLVFGVTRDAAHPAVASLPPKPAASVAPEARSPLAPKLEPSWIDVGTREQRTFAHAVVALDAGTRVRFDDASTTLVLERGRAEVDVDVTRGAPFRVVTRHFRVEVLGTAFSVTPESVSVQRGRVQVYALDGEVLAKELGPGASFSYERGVEQVVDEPSTVPSRTWLARAREALAQGDTRTARELVRRAEESEPHRSDRAEAGTLRAEAALLDHDPKAAVRLYASVAERFADLVAGENAAFAAAQLSTRVEGVERGRELYARYLKRYPRGRFADEARVRLGR